ncbi:MAG: hypothetical protein KA886_07875 [Candidatus Cloacimonetes bacterium]|nr:hypothetical protein [Candidatus Cloacimonadota bacterium]
MTMERDDIERITRMEEKIDNIGEKVDKFLEIAEDYRNHPYECEKKFVKREDFETEFDKNMIRYQEKTLQRKNNLLNFINNTYKLIVTIAVIIITFNQIIAK